MTNQDKFYTSISKYYSEIFPFNQMQLNFVKNELSSVEGVKILDLGCATGELAFQLANSGAIVYGIDINEDLINQAIAFKTHANLHFRKGNMLQISEDFSGKLFDCVICFGNTLVHLQNHNLIENFFHQVFTVLRPNQKFLIQILNYDYIIKEKITELPLIETANIKFNRKYSFEKAKIQFITDLFLKNEERLISNKTELLPLRKSDLAMLLVNAGFKNIRFFSNFKSESFTGTHLPLIVSCNKQ